MNNDIVTKARLNAALGTEGNMGYEHNDIVTVDVMNKAIAEGGGGGGADSIKTAKVTLSVNAGDGYGALNGEMSADRMVSGYAFVYNGELSPAAVVAAGSNGTFDAVLVVNDSDEYSATYLIYGGNIQVTGDAELDNDELVVRGDCTVTVDPIEME